MISRKSTQRRSSLANEKSEVSWYKALINKLDNFFIPFIGWGKETLLPINKKKSTKNQTFKQTKSKNKQNQQVLWQQEHGHMTQFYDNINWNIGNGNKILLFITNRSICI